MTQKQLISTDMKINLRKSVSSVSSVFYFVIDS